MQKLILKPGPVLVARLHRPEASGEAMWQERDVTKSAHEVLFESFDVDPDATLGDLLCVFDQSPLLLEIFRREFVNELMVEVRKGPLVDEVDDPNDALDYVEFYQHWAFDSHSKAYDGVGQLHMRGVGVPLVTDMPDEMRSKGERQSWGLSCLSVRKLLKLPLRINRQVQVTEGDVHSNKYGDTVVLATSPDVTLGQVLQGALDELTFYGSPEQTQAFENELHKRMEDVKSGRAQTIAFDDLLAELYEPGNRAAFFATGAFTAAQVVEFIKSLDDEVAVAPAVQEHFGPDVVLTPKFEGLSARQFRQEHSLASCEAKDEGSSSK